MMRKILWLPLLALLCLLLCSAALAEQVAVDGVFYELDGDTALITGFEAGRKSVSIPAKIQGLATCGWEDEEDAPEGDLPEEILFLDGITTLEPYHELLSRVRRISLPASYFEEWNDSGYVYDDGFLFHAPYLEALSLSAAFPAESLADIAERVKELYWESQYMIRDVDIYYEQTVDPALYRSFHSIKIDPAHPTLYDMDGIVYEKGTDLLLLCPPGRVGAVVIPEGTTGIAKNAFDFCDRVESISLPRSLKSIGERAFENCGALRSIWLPPALEEIGERAFVSCVSLASIIIPDGVSVGEGAFDYCESLRSVYLMGESSVIHPTAFLRCSRQLVLYAAKDSPGWAAAQAGEFLWAEPDGEPARLLNPNRIHRQPAYVRESDEDEFITVYEKPSAAARELAALPAGETVNVLEESDGWARIALADGEGFVPLTDLFLLPLDGEALRILQVNSGVVEFKLYDSPFPDAASTPGDSWDKYPVIEAFGGWYLIDDNGTPRYVRVSDCIEHSVNFGGPEMKAVHCAEGEQMTRLYQEPSLDSPVIGEAYDGMQAVVLGEEDDFTHVLLYGVEGYIASEHLAYILDDWFHYAY